MGPYFAMRAISTESTIILAVFVHEIRQIQNKQVWSECHIINYLLTLLTKLYRGIMALSHFSNGPYCSQSILLQNWANISQ